MKPLDRVLQRWRIFIARPYVLPGKGLLDIGCADCALLERLDRTVPRAVGIDPDAEPQRTDRMEIVQGGFPDDLDGAEHFGTISILAVLEHIPTDQQPGFAAACFDRLDDGGRVIVTVPSPFVDHILHVLMWMRILDARTHEQHYGFEPAQTAPLFEDAGFRTLKRRRFQLGLNNLFVFQRPDQEAAAREEYSPEGNRRAMTRSSGPAHDGLRSL